MSALKFWSTSGNPRTLLLHTPNTISASDSHVTLSVGVGLRLVQMHLLRLVLSLLQVHAELLAYRGAESAQDLLEAALFLRGAAGGAERGPGGGPPARDPAAPVVCAVPHRKFCHRFYYVT